MKTETRPKDIETVVKLVCEDIVELGDRIEKLESDLAEAISRLKDLETPLRPVK